MYGILRPPWSLKCDDRCPQPAIIFKGLAITFKGLAVIYKGHLSSLLKYQGGLKIQYITVHYRVMVHFWKTKITYSFLISAKNAIKWAKSYTS